MAQSRGDRVPADDMKQTPRVAAAPVLGAGGPGVWRPAGYLVPTTQLGPSSWAGRPHSVESSPGKTAVTISRGILNPDA